MNEEIIKKLKDAGFPQPKIDCDDPWVCCKHHHYFTDGNRNDNPYEPTLPELIEECGKDFWRLEQGDFMTSPGFMTQGNVKGIATPNLFFGSTPEEAVAKLWLALNHKEA